MGKSREGPGKHSHRFREELRIRLKLGYEEEGRGLSLIHI